MKTLTKEIQTSFTPEKAIEILKMGNERFVNNLKANRNLLQQVNETSDGQHPFAVVLSCIDSRTSAELIFDQGLGDIFSIRIAGNILNEDILGSMEFACKIAGALLAVVMGVVLNELFKIFSPELALGGDKLVQLPVAKSITGFFNQFTLPDFTAFNNYHVYVVAITLAIIASLETLLSIGAADKIDPYKRNTSTNRELKAQGIGNIISGLIGGLPLTAVIVRTSANVNAGGKTKLAAIIHGLLLLLSVIGLASVLNKIPLSCLAAVLLLVGYKLTKVSLFKSMFKLGWEQYVPFIITIIAIQFSDLLKGIGIGMAVSLFIILRNNYKLAYTSRKEDNQEGEKIIIQLAEDVSFLNKGSIALSLRELPENSTVIIDGTNSRKIDIDVLELIHDFKITAELENIKVELKNIPDFKGVAGH